MTLEEAKEMLKEMKETATHYKKDITIQSVYEALEDTEKALDIVLNYIENESIPKEKVKDRIEEIRGIGWQPGTRTAGKSVKYWKLVGKEEALQELLGE